MLLSLLKHSQLTQYFHQPLDLKESCVLNYSVVRTVNSPSFMACTLKVKVQMHSLIPFGAMEHLQEMVDKLWDKGLGQFFGGNKDRAIVCNGYTIPMRLAYQFLCIIWALRRGYIPIWNNILGFKRPCCLLLSSIFHMSCTALSSHTLKILLFLRITFRTMLIWSDRKVEV